MAWSRARMPVDTHSQPGVSSVSTGSLMTVRGATRASHTPPLTRVLSSNPDAVETMAISPTQVVVEGKAPGGSSLILWGNDGQSQVLDVVANIDIAGLRAVERNPPAVR